LLFTVTNDKLAGGGGAGHIVLAPLQAAQPVTDRILCQMPFLASNLQFTSSGRQTVAFLLKKMKGDGSKTNSKR